LIYDFLEKEAEPERFEKYAMIETFLFTIEIGGSECILILPQM